MNFVLESVVVVRLPSRKLSTVPMAPRVSANGKFAHDAVGRDLDDAHFHQARKKRSENLLK